MATDPVFPPLVVGVLGPLHLMVDGVAVDVPGVKRRAVLALLALAADRVVTVDDLVDALWADHPPDGARAALHSHVFRLRRHLGAAASRLEAVDNGYRLHLEPDELDVERARALLAEARSLLPDDAATAYDLAREAQALWRGRPLAELDEIRPIAARTLALEALRQEVDDLLVECAIESGDATSAVAAARTGLDDDPLREGAAVLLVRALAASGRRAEALRAAHEFRRRLREEAGLEPSPQLAALERSVASGAPAAGTAVDGAGNWMAAAQPSAVPAPATPIVGRDAEIAAVSRLLASERVVTIVGPGGVGKTRLAVEVARRHDDVCFLPLAPLDDGAAIPFALATALHLDAPAGDVLSSAIALLGAGRRLLVVDNCEHVVLAARELVATLVSSCPELTVLATSREPLGVQGECQVRLEPLALLDPHPGAPERSPAVAVFLDRARRVRPGFSPRADDISLIGAIVRRLDGLPLSIELAAGRLSSLALPDLYERLDRSLDLLRGGARNPRHETLRATVQWSYDLLPDHEQRLFRHLAVFADGVDLTTAEALAGELALQGEAAAAIAHLVDASMLEAHLDGSTRYRMLETLRAFALDRLEAEGERREAEDRMLRWACELARWADAAIDSSAEAEVNGRLRRELANLRGAWKLARRRGDLDRAIELVVSLAEPSAWRDIAEVWEWAAEVAADPALPAHPRAAEALAVASDCAWLQGDVERAARLAEGAFDLARGGEGLWRALSALAVVDLARGRFSDAVRRGLEAAALAARPAPIRLVAALAAAYDGDVDLATRIIGEAQPQSPTSRANSAYVAGECAAIAGRLDEAEQHYRRAIEIARTVEATFVVGIASLGAVTVAASTGRTGEALRGYRELLQYWERAGNWIQLWTTLRNLALLLRRLGDDERAAYLDVAADRAPEAPAVSVAWRARAGQATGAGNASASLAAGPVSRREVLDLARRAIDEALSRVGDGST